MVKLVLSVFISFVLLVPVMAQSDKTEGHIMWTEDYQLVWDDFQAKPKKRHFASAMSDITFSVNIQSENNLLKVYVQPSFNPKGSWVKTEDRTDYLLNHEQVHFDIYEVNARKLRKELATKKINSNNAQDILNRLVEKYGELNVKIQERYDEETEHSIKEAKQEKWNERIKSELEELSDYKEAAFTVKVEMK